MPKFHVNPGTGEAGMCRARTRCPFGDIEKDHYESPEQARTAYETAMADLVVPDALGPVIRREPEPMFELMRSEYKAPQTVVNPIRVRVEEETLDYTYGELKPGELVNGQKIVGVKPNSSSPYVYFDVELEDGTVTETRYPKKDVAYSRTISKTIQNANDIRLNERALKEYSVEENYLNYLPVAKASLKNMFERSRSEQAEVRRLTKSLNVLVEELKEKGDPAPHSVAYEQLKAGFTTPRHHDVWIPIKFSRDPEETFAAQNFIRAAMEKNEGYTPTPEALKIVNNVDPDSKNPLYNRWRTNHAKSVETRARLEARFEAQKPSEEEVAAQNARAEADREARERTLADLEVKRVQREADEAKAEEARIAARRADVFDPSA